MTDSMEKAICPQCRAPFDIPETGLTMTCAFCGYRTAVPDADERREELEAQKEQERARRSRAAQQQRREEQREQDRRKRTRTTLLKRLIRTTVRLAILGGIAFGVYKLGGLDYWWGDPGAAYFQNTDYRLRIEGYTLFAGPKEVGITQLPVSFGDDGLYSLSSDYCYALTAASGKPIQNARLMDPRDRPVSTSNQKAFVHTIRFCPQETGLYELSLSSASLSARAAVGAYYRPKPAAVPTKKGRK